MEKRLLIEKIEMIDGQYYYCESITQGRNIFIADTREKIDSLKTMAYAIWGIDDCRLDFSKGVSNDNVIIDIRLATDEEKKLLDTFLVEVIKHYARLHKLDTMKFTKEL